MCCAGRAEWTAVLAGVPSGEGRVEGSVSGQPRCGPPPGWTPHSKAALRS